MIEREALCTACCRRLRLCLRSASYITTANRVRRTKNRGGTSSVRLAHAVPTMSRVTALLGGKRNKGISGDAGSNGSKVKDTSSTSSIASTPERDRGTSPEARRVRDASYAESVGVTGSADRSSVIRRQPSSSSIVLHATTPDGTPIVYGSTTNENHSRPGKLNVEDAGTNGKARRGTFSRGGPALDLPRAASIENGISYATDDSTASSSQYAMRGTSAFQPVGEGSLSLDTLLGASSHDVVTPKAGYLPFSDSGVAPPGHPELFVTDASPLPSPVPGSKGPSFRRSSATGSIQYPPVFEHSDLGSSSSSSAVSRAEAADYHQSNSDDPLGLPPIQVHHPADDHRARSMSSAYPSVSLAPPPGFDSNGSTVHRGRASTSASTMPSGRRSASPSPARSSTMPVKPSKSSKKGSNGIAGALALSGVAFASPGPGVAQPFQMARKAPAPVEVNRPRPSKQRTGSSGVLSAPAHASTFNGNGHDRADRQVPERNSTEEGDGFESPTPLSNYTPNDSPRYEDDPAFHAMVSMDVLGDFDDVVTQIGTGYALASSKRNAEFHALFKNVPEEDYLIEGRFFP